MFAKKPKMAKEWAKKTKSIKDLPESINDRADKAKKKLKKGKK